MSDPDLHSVAHGLRAAEDTDAAFCRDLILATVGVYWTADPGESLAESHARKFAAEWAHDLLPNSRIVELDTEPAGLLTVYREDARVFVRYLLLEPAHQGRGIGSAILRRELAGAGPLPVELKVDRPNARAQRFYERLNFRLAESTPDFVLMRYDPEATRPDD